MRITLLIPAATAARPDEPISAPLGLAYIAANLLTHGFDVTIYDAATLAPPEKLADGKWRIGLDAEALAERTAQNRPDLIGISCPFTTRYGPFKRLVSALHAKLPGVPLIAGGIHPSILPVKVLEDNNLDCVVLGEGEITFLELVRRYEQTGRINPEGLDGVAWRQDGNVRLIPRQHYIENLDELPDPARHLLDITAYLKRSGGRWSSRRKSVLSVLTSRSCPGRCSFCSVRQVFGPRWHGRSAERVIAETIDVWERYHPDLIAFEDDRLTCDRERMKQILHGLIAYSGRIKWYEPNGIHLDDLDEEILALMKASGCFSLNLAIESGDPDILHRVMGKAEHLEHTVKMVKECQRLGIRTNGYFVIGMPGETDASIEKSLRFCLELPLDGLGLAIATPFPGTRMFDECVSAGYFNPENLLEKFYEAADADLLHEPLFETPTLCRERLIWWSDHFKSEFQRNLFRRRPSMLLKHWVNKATSMALPR